MLNIFVGKIITYQYRVEEFCFQNPGAQPLARSWTRAATSGNGWGIGTVRIIMPNLPLLIRKVHPAGMITLCGVGPG